MKTTLTGSPIQAGVAPTPAERWSPPQLSGKSPRLIAPTEVAANSLQVALDASAAKVKAARQGEYRALLFKGTAAVQSFAENDPVAFAALLAGVGIDTADVMADLAVIERRDQQAAIVATWPDDRITKLRETAAAADAAITPVREELERLQTAKCDADAQLHRARYSRNDAEVAIGDIEFKNARVFGK